MRVQISAGSVGEITAETLLIPIARRGETPSSLPRGLSAIDRRMGGRLSDALAAGDIALAAKILWLSLKMEWKRGIHFLNGLWI